MGRVAELIGKVFSLADHNAVLTVFGDRTPSGKAVTPTNALTLSVVWACIRLLSEVVGQLTIDFHRVDRRGGRRRTQLIDDHRLWRIFNVSPNARMDPQTFREAMMVNLLTWGNAYARISRDSRGNVISLDPILSERVRVRILKDGSVVYEIHFQGAGIEVAAPQEIFHVKLFGFNGIVGLSPIRAAAQSLGHMMAVQEFGARFFGHGVRPGGFLKVSRFLKPEQREQIRANFENLHEGLENSHTLALLEGDIDFAPSTIPPEEAQFLQTMQFQIPEGCRWYLVPPHMVQDLSRATFSNIEAQDLQFLKFTMAPYFSRWENAIECQLLPAAEKGIVQAVFDTQRLLRTDLESQAIFYPAMVRHGIMSRDEARLRLGENARGGSADELTVEANMIDLDDLVAVGGREPGPEPDEEPTA